MLFFNTMAYKIEENPTRQKILILLKKNGGMTNEELSNFLQITPMGVRQHLLSLEKKGIITYNTVRHGIGRPNFVYRLTNKADRYFPSNYDNFAMEILKDLEDLEGREAIERLFRRRKERILSKSREILGNGHSLKEKIDIMSGFLSDKGYLVEVSSNGAGYTLRQFNCPIKAISQTYFEVCKNELDLYRELFGDGVERKECMSKGDLSCEYFIPERQPAS